MGVFNRRNFVSSCMCIHCLNRRPVVTFPKLACYFVVIGPLRSKAASFTNGLASAAEPRTRRDSAR
jgi:hypothetical protein